MTDLISSTDLDLNMPNNEKAELLSLTREELQTLLNKISENEPRYRAGQLFTQLQHGTAPEDMTNISKSLKASLGAAAYYHIPTIEQRLVSALDGTVKYLLGLVDGNCIEAVLMEYEHGTSICISSQVGCRMGCRFCASTTGGRIRNLTAGEMLGQILAVQKDSGKKVSSLVMMGIGEPLDNYDSTVRFLHMVNDRDGQNIGYRHISLSTCGLVPQIYRLAKERLPITLSISLHAPDDRTRSEIMPVNNSYGIDELMRACLAYYSETGRRITFEYTLISGKNDSREQALRLSELLNSSLRRRTKESPSDLFPIHVNLIPVNAVAESGFTRSSRTAIEKFVAVLEAGNIRATVRRRLGPDINASCGQLRKRAALERLGHEHGDSV